MSAELSLKLTNRSPTQPIKKLPPSINIPANATVEDAKVAIARKTGTADFNRIGLFDPTTKKTLKDRKAVINDLKYEELLVKDLGPQLAWRTVFLIEYLGPLLFHPLVLALRSSIYPSPGRLSASQQLTFGCVMVHFVRRELETAYVHRFSASTMPVSNVFRNSFFYWAIAGLLAALEVYAPFSPAARAGSSTVNALGLGLFVVGELMNFRVHHYLSTLRSPGGTERQIPRGLGFGLVTSPNYMYEQVAWAGIILISRSPSITLFIALGMYYMYIWGVAKERAYRQEFGDKYKKKRYVMLPGLL